MNRGVPTLSNPHRLCEGGQELTAEQTQLLKLIGEKMVVFRVGLTARWDSATGEVVNVEGTRIVRPEEQGEDCAEADEDAMSE
jgi:mRNA turnover protein 4